MTPLTHANFTRLNACLSHARFEIFPIIAARGKRLSRSNIMTQVGGNVQAVLRTWLDQLRRDNGTPPADLWRRAVTRGHSEVTRYGP